MIRPPAPPAHRGPVTRWGAVVCLLAHLLGGAGILPSVLLLAALCDSSHVPAIGLAEDHFDLVLHHWKSHTGLPVTRTPFDQTHRHGLVASYLCVLAAQDPSDLDHHLEVAKRWVSEPAGERAAVIPRVPDDAWPGWLAREVRVTASSADLQTVPPLDHGPPAPPGSLFASLFTVLVI